MKLKNNKNIFGSISSGLSSVLMAIKLKKWYPDHKIVFAMANTSRENKESLKFMQECSEYYDLDVMWIEAVINPEKGFGTGYRVVDYEGLKRDGEIFEQGIKKYGIPSKINKWCNREMKVVPLTKFANDIFGKDNYSVAVGLRTDEIDKRLPVNYRESNVFYPLVDNNINYRDRNKFWKDQPIKLKIESWEGNCDFCFEKSNRKKMTIAKQTPEKTIWWDKMEEKYSLISIEGKDAYNSFVESGGSFFGRENISTKELVEMAKKPFAQATDEYIYENDLFDLEGDCGSGCQVF